VIALGTVKDSTLAVQAAVVSGIAALMTIGVYGLVAMIVKLDDAGLYLMKTNRGGMVAGLGRHIGSALVGTAPYLMKLLSIVGTLAMFMVGGGIMVHGLTPLQDFLNLLEARILSWPAHGRHASAAGRYAGGNSRRGAFRSNFTGGNKAGGFRVQSSGLKKPIGQHSAAPCRYRTEAGPLNAAANRHLRVTPPRA
jgi:hypothetical protein